MTGAPFFYATGKVGFLPARQEKMPALSFERHGKQLFGMIDNVSVWAGYQALLRVYRWEKRIILAFSRCLGAQLDFTSRYRSRW